jgi:hypothetical protein
VASQLGVGPLEVARESNDERESAELARARAARSCVGDMARRGDLVSRTPTARQCLALGNPPCWSGWASLRSASLCNHVAFVRVRRPLGLALFVLAAGRTRPD